eukprot:gnl/Spiro4/28518_TR14102_c0_g1_i1.p1 gnl/Spiro4/28518_TR14102_c0_g1~~gnl/Spiro4/28518_TR14102_c0_g1_i1.p1  ORF type:complete len:276 (+),score=77.41 gnl/Spiro4/28518_TR14102_c0_g1_i1:67-828(+)
MSFSYKPDERMACDSENTLVKYEPVPTGDLAARMNRHRDLRGKEEKSPIPSLEDVLNEVLPPKEYKDDLGTTWVQPVSTQPATRQDVLKLEELLNLRLKKVWPEGQARDTGICPIREELYSQCFDELLRQITIQCQERGRLLHRVREEARLNVNSYRALYESSIAFGMRKALQAEQNRLELEERIAQLEKQLASHVQNHDQMISKTNAAQAQLAETRQKMNEKHKNELSALKKENGIIRSKLESCYTLASNTS